MQQSFIHPDFLLSSATARSLYHDIAECLPIIDYHCHLSPAMIASDHHFTDITELWLAGDHYKWRAMRANGIEERYITGDAEPKEKFDAWAKTVPYTLRNPLYHWTAMELKRPFGIDTLLTPETADEIYEECNRILSRPDMGARGIIKHFNVKVVCTTDDPIDSLEHHRAIAESDFEVKILPAWRPDKAMAGADPIVYRNYIDTLQNVSGIEITSYDSLVKALEIRHQYFADNGCTVADHGLSHVPFCPCSHAQANDIFQKMLDCESLEAAETEAFNTNILLDLCRMNSQAGWVQQFHFGPMRNVNSRAFATLGPDTGFDTIGDYRAAESLAGILNTLDSDNLLAPTILYNLNPADNVWVAAMAGNFQDGSRPGKIQMGAAWWFNDQLDGMKAQLDALSTQGLLSRFVGMLTDSRSLVSYTRHDYFRRLLCRMLGQDIDDGIIPSSQIQRVREMVADISFNNANNYFKFNVL